MKSYTVAEFTKSMKLLLESAYSESVAITGEVSNLSLASSGHRYFTLKDPSAQLKAVYFKRYSMGGFVPKNGDKVQAIGDITLYEADGSYQLLVKRIMYDSVGLYWQRFEETKRVLEAEGFFDEARKRPIPAYPRRIALITSLTGAAIRDFLVTAKGAFFDIELWGVPVQGADAVSKIVAAVNSAGRAKERYDVLVLMRGGGSLEDLAVFNEEPVARALAISLVPTISAVGHERDITVIDFVSDKRVATPTAAAVLLSTGYKDAAKVVEDFLERVIGATVSKVQKLYQRIDNNELRLKNRSPEIRFIGYRNRLRLADNGLKFYILKYLDKMDKRVAKAQNVLDTKKPEGRLAVIKIMVDNFEARLINIATLKLSNYNKKLTNISDKLNILDPANILERGYALILKGDKVIASVHDVSLQEDIEIKLKDGYISSFVTGKRGKKS